MKKILLGLSLMGVVASANAAIVPINASYGLVNNGTYSFNESSSIQYFQFFNSRWNSKLTVRVNSGEANLALFKDLGGVFTDAVADINGTTNSLVANTGVVFSGTSGLVTYALEAGKVYVLRIRADATAPFAALASVATVPLPAAAWLFGSGLVGLGALRRKKSLAIA